MRIVAYTGPNHNECPISLTKLQEIEHPVAFSDTPDQPYEYDQLVAWLVSYGGTDPKTRAHRSMREIVILHIKDTTTQNTIRHIQQHSDPDVLQVIFIN